MADPYAATAYWSIPPGTGELRDERLSPPTSGEALVRTVHSGVSRGTERLVHAGAIPEKVADRMRAPFQVGDLAGPVKYGYLSVGVVEEGPPAWIGRWVFSLFPHQDRYVVPLAALTEIPSGVPPRRALLAGAMETGINALWDAGPRLGDRIAVVGGGLIGGTVGGLLRTFPLERLQLVDINPAREAVAEAFGIEFVHPDDAAEGCDLVIHASATAAGLNRCFELAGDEAEILELSWYGTEETPVTLGADFHARRLTFRASQVSAISPARRVRRTHADRMALAFDVLRDDAFDVLLTGSSPFAALPETMQHLADGELDAICHAIDY